jgi:octaprenyl-diphosphate synthase
MIDFKQDILAPVATDFEAMDHFIQTGINSKVPLVMSVSHYVVEAGGKRMRPLMSLLATRACQVGTAANDTADSELSDAPLRLAAIIEMLHTATLVHDDVVDESGLRRGKPTANATWNNATAVLVGDYLIARAFDLLVNLHDFDLLKEFSSGTCEIAEGEVLQLQHQHNPDTDEATYLKIIHGKTSRLFELATEGAAILCKKTEYRAALKAYAGHFGNAFQIIDDILDYTSDPETLGKNIGDDLMEGKPTLPLIAAMAQSSGAQQQLLKTTIQTGGIESLQQVIDIVHQSGALDYCRQRAKNETDAALAALDTLPESVYRLGLENLAKIALSRIS